MVSEVSSPPKTALFLHIPKTAGTSFLLMLRNAFGDNRVKRFESIDERIKPMVDAVIENELAAVSCLTGHLPVWLFAERMDLFKPFTVLRDPVSRVLSLYRFLKASAPDNLQRLGIRSDTPLGEFLESRHPEIYSQINNGMTRMLCGDRLLQDSAYPEFWSAEAQMAACKRSLALIEQIDFGLAEDMPSTLRLARACWGMPYELPEYRENVTNPTEGWDDTESLHRIVLMNSLDTALYHRALAIFRTRTRAAVAGRPNPLTIYHPPLNSEVSVADIPGRKGFHEFEPGGFAWLHEGPPAQINFELAPGKSRLFLKLYGAVADYPGADIVVRLNGHALSHITSFASDRWGWLQTEPFETSDGLNLLEIEAPLFVPASLLQEGGKDQRNLGVALAQVTFKT